MKRRDALCALSCFAVSGCVSLGRNGSSDGRTTGDEQGYGGLQISEIRPEEVEREYIGYEYVEIQNDSDRTIDVGGVTVVYDQERRHQLAQLELSGGAKIIVLSRDSEESTLETDPPVHVRSAELGDGVRTSVLESPGEISLERPSGGVIHQRSY